MSLYVITIVAQLPLVPVTRHADAPLVRAAFELAEKTDRTVYDSLYLVLAERLAGKVVTADDRFVNAATVAASVFAAGEANGRRMQNTNRFSIGGTPQPPRCRERRWWAVPTLRPL